MNEQDIDVTAKDIGLAALCPPRATSPSDARMDLARLRSLLDVLPDAVVLTDGDGRITLLNDQTAALFGFDRADLLGQPVEILLPARFHGTHRRQRTHYNAHPRLRPMGTGLRLVGQRRDGQEFPVEVSLSPLAEAEHPERLMVLAIIRDISERLRAEDERLRLDLARREAEAATEELRRVQAITDVALAHRSLDTLLPALLTRISAALQIDNVAILLTDMDQQILTVRAACGLEEEVAAGVRVPVGQGFAGRIAASRAPLVVEDLTTFPVVNSFLSEQLCSVAGVPLLVDGRLIGVVHMGSATPRAFPEREVRLLQLIAERIALAIEQARLIEAEQAALARAQVSEQRFARVFAANLIGVIVAEGDQILEANEPFLQMVGYTRADLEAGCLRWQEMTPPEYASLGQRNLEELRERGMVPPFEKAYIHKDGRQVPVLMGAVLLERDPLRWVCFVVDLSERKWLEQQREEAQARELAMREMNQHLDEFFTIAAHDIRNPVGAVKGNLQLARRRFEKLWSIASDMAVPTGDNTTAALPSGVSMPGAAELAARLEALRANLELAEASTDRLTRLTTQLFDVARARTGKLELEMAPCDLVALVRDQVEAQRLVVPERTIALDLPADQRTVMVRADADRLSQVVANYLTNALKYSAEDQPITVALEVTAEVAVVWVRDHGPGLPWAEQSQIWELFHRAPGVQVRSQVGDMVGSLGMGLHICKQIVELHPGGHVGVESMEGHGATFWLRLPLLPGKRDDPQVSH